MLIVTVPKEVRLQPEDEMMRKKNLFCFSFGQSLESIRNEVTLLKVSSVVGGKIQNVLHPSQRFVFSFPSFRLFSGTPTRKWRQKNKMPTGKSPCS
jgi:hypothetical protein